ILEEFCRERNAPFAPLAGIAFFPLVLSAKLLTVGAWPFLSAAVSSGQGHTVMMATCLATAFLVTIGAFFVVRYGWSEDRGSPEARDWSGDQSGARGGADGCGAVGAAAVGAVGADAGAADGFGAGGFGTAGFGGAAGPDGEAAWLTGDVGRHASTEDEERRALELIRIRYGLTNREFDVLRLTAAGHTQKGMANELYLSVNSVSTYVKALHAKLGVHSKQEIIDLVQRTRVERK
ncbi:MAG: LuxR C-terminal-related transcriptional regulator, partial [Eggerthellales bacterium]|nr:LuxR C-terminal-related transcriptional regulator [Eggerthellales bacterium]